MKLNKDTSVIIFVFLLLMATVAFYNWPTPEIQNIKFGWEYGNIAASLVNGRGFSSPFDGVDTGPTAWMPPLYVFLLAGVFYLFGVKSIAALWVMFVFKYVAISLCLFMLLRLADKTGYEKYRYLIIPLFLGPIYLNRTTFFKELHDVWLNLLLSCLMLFTFVAQILDKEKRTDVFLLILAFILPIANPALALAFLVFESGYFLLRTYTLTRSKPSSEASTYQYLLLPHQKARLFRPRKGSYKLILLLMLFASSSLLWTYRNYQIFGTFIPVKSNLWFDFYQANDLDRDGLVTYATFVAFNPSNPNPFQMEYAAKGEVQFTQDYRRLAITEIQRDPYSLFKNIGRRAFSALIYLDNPNDIRTATRWLFTLEDRRKLGEANLLRRATSPDGTRWWLEWISLTLPEDEFVAKVKTLGLTFEAAVIRDWLENREDVAYWNRSLRIVVKTISISLIPFIALIFDLAWKKSRNNVVFICAAIIYFVYLAPYILVSHYLRYQAPLIGIQVIFTFFLASFVLDHILMIVPNYQSWQLELGNWQLEIRYNSEMKPGE